MTIAINEIVIRTLKSIAECKAKLEVEESGREVASLQGHLGGYKQLLSFLAAEFSLNQAMIEDTADEPTTIQELDDVLFAGFKLDVIDLKQSEGWMRLVLRIVEKTGWLKDRLLFTAEKSRDLDLSQGFYKGMISYESFFNAVEGEAERRDKEAERKRKEPELDFDNEGFDDREQAV